MIILYLYHDNVYFSLHATRKEAGRRLYRPAATEKRAFRRYHWCEVDY